MKFLLILFVFFIFSCSPKISDLVGKWEYKSNYLVINGERQNNLNSILDSLILNADGSCIIFHELDSIGNMEFCNWSVNNNIINFTNRITNSGVKLPDVDIGLLKVNTNVLSLKYKYKLATEDQNIQHNSHIIENYKLLK